MTDVEAIQATISRYTLAVCRRDYPAVRDVFTDDAVWELPEMPGARADGGDAIGGLVRNFLEGTRFLAQMNAPAIITVDGDEAAATSVMREVADVPADGERVEVHGLYEDRLRRTPDGWRFTHRRFVILQQRKTPL